MSEHNDCFDNDSDNNPLIPGIELKLEPVKFKYLDDLLNNNSLCASSVYQLPYMPKNHGIQRDYLCMVQLNLENINYDNCNDYFMFFPKAGLLQFYKKFCYDGQMVIFDSCDNNIIVRHYPKINMDDLDIDYLKEMENVYYTNYMSRSADNICYDVVGYEFINADIQINMNNIKNDDKDYITKKTNDVFDKANDIVNMCNNKTNNISYQIDFNTMIIGCRPGIYIGGFPYCCQRLASDEFDAENEFCLLHISDYLFDINVLCTHNDMSNGHYNCGITHITCT